MRWLLLDCVSMRSGSNGVRVVEGGTLMCEEVAVEGAISQALFIILLETAYGHCERLKTLASSVTKVRRHSDGIHGKSCPGTDP